MDPLRLSLALGPLAIYLLLLGTINLSRRPLLVEGCRDAFALGLAVSGLVVIGPMELFFPFMAARSYYVAVVWSLLIGIYFLWLVLLVLMLRHRLVIYNISAEELRPILAQLMVELDPEARWAGDSAVLPNLGIQMRMELVSAMRNVSLIANSRQETLGWRRLEQELGAVLRQVKVARNPRALVLILAALLLAGSIAYVVTRDPQAVAHGLFDVVHALFEMVQAVLSLLRRMLQL